MVISMENLRQQLEQQRAELQAELAEVGARAEAGMGYSTHQADDGTIAFDQTADLAVRRHTERMLYQVERALVRMREGTYGICRKCAKPIDHARLRAIPYARCCMDCACRDEEL
jgi:RNA polymerase-binding protein DksA